MTSSYQFGAFRGRMKTSMKRLWTSTKGDRADVNVPHETEHAASPPPPYAEASTKDAPEVCIKNFEGSSGAGTDGKAASTPNGASAAYTTESTDQMSIARRIREFKKESIARFGGTLVIPQLECDYNPQSYSVLTKLVAGKVSLAKVLRSVLVYIIFVTFNANLDELPGETDGLFPWEKFQYTVECARRSEVLVWSIVAVTRELSSLVRYAERELRYSRLFNVRQIHKDLLHKHVLKPAKKLQIQPDYALEILGGFVDEGGRALLLGGLEDSGRSNSLACRTLLDLWEPSNKKDLPLSSPAMIDYADALGSHASFLSSLNLQERLQTAVEDSMDAYIRTRSLQKIRMSEELKQKVLQYQPHETCCWPLRNGYMDLFRMLGGPYNAREEFWRDHMKRARQFQWEKYVLRSKSTWKGRKSVRDN